ncbi:MAG TPA: hypothetical protein VFC30_09320 [Solirubrobacteraceae bacterium]|nr:hypothetical protein [Solirubrobacteraceae bacterium]
MPKPRRRRLTATVVGLVVMCLALPSAASATSAVPLRRLVASTVAFASDGSRYVAWQTRTGAPVVVFDTRTGAQRRLGLPDGCELANEEERTRGRDAAAGRFLLNCRGGRSLESALLNGRDGTIIRLPNAADWTAVGTRYVLGVSEASTCVQSRSEQAIGEEHGLPCLALYDLASGEVSYRPPSLWPDIDEAGAPPICPSLRAKVIAEELIGGVEREFDYNAGWFARPAKHRRYIEVNRCNGRRTTLAAHSDESENFDLRGGWLTWDTGHPSGELEREGEGTNTGSLAAYDLFSHRLTRWTLPRLSVRETDRGFSIVGILGYSTHTANMVFWIATTAGAVTGAGVEVKSSAVYAASTR